MSLNQRLLRLTAPTELYKAGKLVKPDGAILPLRGQHVPVSIDLRGAGPKAIVGYKAKKTTNTIDVSRVGQYDPREFWEKIQDIDGRLPLDKGDFYILATREEVGVPPDLARK